MSIYIENPSGNRIGPLDEKLGPQRYRLGNTDLLIYYGKPGPYHLTQEIYIDFLPGKTYVDSGDWKIILSGKKVRGGEYYLWLPGGKVEFYKSLGFEVIMQSYNEKQGKKWHFLQIKITV